MALSYDTLNPSMFTFTAVENVDCLSGYVGITTLTGTINLAPKIAIRCVLNLIEAKYTGEWYHPQSNTDIRCYLPCDKIMTTGTATIAAVQVMYVLESF